MHAMRNWNRKQNRFTVEKIFVELGSESLRNRQILRCHFVAPMGAQNAGNIPWQSLRSAAGDAVWTATLKALKHMRPCLSPDRLIAILTKELSGVGHSDMLWRSLKLPFFNRTMASLPCILACAYLWILYILYIPIGWSKPASARGLRARIPSGRRRAEGCASAGGQLLHLCMRSEEGHQCNRSIQE